MNCYLKCFLIFIVVFLLFVNVKCADYEDSSEEEKDDGNDGDGERNFMQDLEYPRDSYTDTLMMYWRIMTNPLPSIYKAIQNVFTFLNDYYPPPRSGILQEYDFVIVGAGPAGCVLASRLSEVKEWKVLLLEDGGPESVLTNIPAIAAGLQSTDYNWGYRQEKQKGLCRAMQEERCHWPRGRGIGGSSIINGMIYTRGNRVDWDRIAAAGNPGWSFDEVMPYFLKSERANLQEGLENSPFHNKNGYMSVEHGQFKTPLLDAFLDAAVELGHNIADYNSGIPYGFGRVQAQTLRGNRHTAAKAFLYPFRDRPNLHILHHARVIKVNINEQTKRAESVEYVFERKAFTVKAKKEIILSAGAFASPQLLMLSGVGPKDHLKELGIKVIKNLPVGENMYDHVGYVGMIFLVNKNTGSTVESEVIANFTNIIEWVAYGRGPLSLAGGVEALGFIKTNASNEVGDHPDIELIFAPGGFTIDGDGTGSVRKGLKLKEEFLRETYGDILGKPSYTIAPMLLHPVSKGYLKLKDSNPYHWPRLYYDYFREEQDLKTLIEGMKYILRFSETEAFKKTGSRIYDKPLPNCRNIRFASDEYWKCATEHLATTIHHQIATCKMGPANDPEAVVDPELRVHGIKKLRVADTSIIPKPIAAHTNAPVVMVGEKAADMIKRSWMKRNF